MFKLLLLTFRRERIWPFAGVFVFLLALESGYFLLTHEFSTRLPFGIRIANAELSLVSTEAAETFLNQKIAEYLNQPLIFTLGERQLQVLPSAIGLAISADKTIESARGQFITFTNQPLDVTIDSKKFRDALLTLDPTLEVAPLDARISFDSRGALVITPDTPGRATDFLALAEEIRASASRLILVSLELAPSVVSATYTSANLELYRAELERVARRPLILKDTEYHRFEIDLTDRLEWFDFSLRYSLAENDAVTLPRSLAHLTPFSGTPTLTLNRPAVTQFITQELSPLVAIPPHAVTITRDLDGKFIFDGVALDGRAVDTEKLIVEIDSALRDSKTEILIPYALAPAPVIASEEVKALGIQTLLGGMETDYTGSPTNRKFNIQLASSKLNGKLLEPGAEFSFISALGPITSELGYRQELVIKEGDTTPEIGGGVCQVSTTIFRAALVAGMPITAQKPHTLKVRYYDPPGLDATIYPGQADLKFKNDTGAPILIQLVVEDARLRVNFYGTSDGRSARLAGPFYPDGRPITHLGSAGLRMYWERFLNFPDGTEKTERYDAAYKVLPKKE